MVSTSFDPMPALVSVLSDVVVSCDQQPSVVSHGDLCSSLVAWLGGQEYCQYTLGLCISSARTGASDDSLRTADVCRDFLALIDQGRGAGDGVSGWADTGRVVRGRHGDEVPRVAAWSLQEWRTALHGEVVVLAALFHPEGVGVET